MWEVAVVEAAVCGCGILAVGRCTVCGAAVCQPHLRRDFRNGDRCVWCVEAVHAAELARQADQDAQFRAYLLALVEVVPLRTIVRVGHSGPALTARKLFGSTGTSVNGDHDSAWDETHKSVVYLCADGTVRESVKGKRRVVETFPRSPTPYLLERLGALERRYARR